MVGDSAPPPPPAPYESPSECRRAVRESLRRTRRGKGSLSEGVRSQYDGEAAETPLKGHASGNRIYNNIVPCLATKIYDRGRETRRYPAEVMAPRGGKEVLPGDQAPAETNSQAGIAQIGRS
jgi:hypothetical protein